MTWVSAIVALVLGVVLIIVGVEGSQGQLFASLTGKSAPKAAGGATTTSSTSSASQATLAVNTTTPPPPISSLSGTLA